MARVLVVDDDPDQLAIRKLLLEREGHVVRTAVDAVDAKVADAPELVLMDLRIPRVEDGLDLIRCLRARDPAPRIVVLSGWTDDLRRAPEASMVDALLAKPCPTRHLLDTIATLALWTVCLLMAGVSAQAAHSFTFEVASTAEVVADLEMRSPGSDWSQPGREAAVVAVTLDGRLTQHVMLYAGETVQRYSIFLGRLAAGEHRLEVLREERHSAPGSALEVLGARFRDVPDSPVITNAPVLFARRNTIGKFSDVPLLVYGERLVEGGQTVLQYTVIFSNEDGGTSTRALMARWGRTTDIEYVYRAYLNDKGEVTRAFIQTRDHKDVEYTGPREQGHALLLPVTDNNMVAGEGTSELRYQLAPVEIDLTRHSREEVMDRNPITYRVAAQELVREAKLRPFGTSDGEKISDQRNYLYLEANVENSGSQWTALVRLAGEQRWRSSNLGRQDYGVERSGWARTTIELPPGTAAAQIAEIAFQCLAPPVRTDRRAPPPGACRLEAVSKVFLLDTVHQPGPSLWKTPPRNGGWLIPTGEMISFALR